MKTKNQSKNIENVKNFIKKIINYKKQNYKRRNNMKEIQKEL